ncbi:MAG: 2-oxo acid dehydrogenase subunit E2, partial [Acidimicrobiales bacterium]|nr:2-oxo acid dehydrogenase subunit E2 [Acidimicrobiales bacterium]
LLREHAVDPAAVEATGPGGRITRADVERHIRATGATAITAPVGGAPPAPAPAPAPATTEGGAPARPPTVVPFTNIRRRTAEHMTLSKQTSPHAYSVIEVDYENVERVRRTVRDTWKAEEGFSLTYLPFIARAVIDALEEFPHLNATVGADELVVEPAVHLGIAVDLDFEGLLAPVVRDAESKRLRAIAREIVDLSGRARTKRLSIDEITGGTFTITNNGSFGTAIVLPIINQPQVGILSTDAITRKPVVVIDGDGGEAIAIHSVGMLALAWDHRAFDGSYAGAFLSHVKQILETRDWAAEL